MASSSSAMRRTTTMNVLSGNKRRADKESSQQDKEILATASFSNNSSRKRPGTALSTLTTTTPARHVDDDDDDVIVLSSNDEANETEELIPDFPVDGVMPIKKFLEMWRLVELDDGWETEDFEATNEFRKANTSLKSSDTCTQAKAQYGRLTFKGTRMLFKTIMNLQYYHRFLDIGHGIGNTVLQAAYTVGCEALGIEVVELRHLLAEKNQMKMAEINDLHNRKRDGKHFAIGTVRMRHGSLESPEHLQFLTQNVDRVFCNNFGCVFGDKSAKARQTRTNDDYLAGQFCLLQEGAVFCTLSELPLPPCTAQVNQNRAKHGFAESDQASFYSLEMYDVSGTGLLSWTDKPFVVYKYTRTGESATFLCSNPTCSKAQQSISIPATRQEGQGNEKRIVVNHCHECRVRYDAPRHEVHVSEEEWQSLQS